MLEIFKDILAAVSGVLNGLPQGLLALAFGFASIPTALAFIVGAAGSAAVGNAAVISYQAETIAVAGTIGRSMRERLSMIFIGAAILLVIGLLGVLESLINWIGPVITNGMMAGVGIMLSKVAWDMAKNDRLVGAVSFVSALIVYMALQDLVYTITVSVILASIISNLQKRKSSVNQEEAVQNEGFAIQKILINPMILRGAMAMVCLNIGANIAFGRINEDIAGMDVDIDTLTIISSLADMASSLFGGAPVEVIISATARAPHAVWSGVLMMALMAVILFAGWLPKIGRYVPSASIAGFLFVLGAIVTLPSNAAAALAEEGAGTGVVGGMTMVVTAVTDPFLGMTAGIIIEFLIEIFGF